MSHFRSFLFKPVRTIALALVLALLPLGAASQQPSSGEPPVQAPRVHDYDVQHYRIAVSFDWAKKSVTGETTITLRPSKKDLREIELDAGEMTIGSVKLAGGAPLKYRYDGKEKLFVELDRAYPLNQDISIAIAYTATPKKGITFVQPSASDPKRPWQIWSQGEAETNHYWFPCYDYPNDRATSETFVTVDDRYQVISNGALVGVERDAARKTGTWHWKIDKPFSSYLISVVVGEFAEVKDQYKGRPVSSYVYRDQVENARISFAKLAQMVAFFSEKTGLDYPYVKYAQTTVRDFPGGMENITATTIADTSVRDKRANLDSTSDDLISHELAHSWFGDMITCGDWGEIWLNESFATLFANLWTEHDNGHDDYLYEIYGNQQTYFRSWYGGIRRPIVTRRYEDPDGLFDAYSYPRGGAVLHMLRFVLGEEQFWKAIRHYVQKYQWQSIATPEFILAIKEATGQDLQWFFDEWVYRMGHPEFEIVQNYDESSKTLKLTVRQIQTPDTSRPWFQDAGIFTMPVDIAITTASGEKINRVTVDKALNEFTFQVDSKPLIVNFDRGNQLIKQVRFNRSDEEKAYQLLHDNDVMGRVRAAIELKSSRGESATKALAEAAAHDRFWAVRLEATRALAEYRTDQSKAALVEISKDGDSRVRRAAIDGLGMFKDQNLADLFINAIQNDPSYFVAGDAAIALGRAGSPKAYDVLVKLLDQDSWQETLRSSGLSGLGELKDKRALDLALKYAAPGNDPNLRGRALMTLAVVGKGDDRVLDVLTRGLKDAVDDRAIQLGINAVQALGAFGDPRAIPALEDASAKLDTVLSFAKQYIGGVITRLKNAPRTSEVKN